MPGFVYAKVLTHLDMRVKNRNITYTPTAAKCTDVVCKSSLLVQTPTSTVRMNTPGVLSTRERNVPVQIAKRFCSTFDGGSSLIIIVISSGNFLRCRVIPTRMSSEILTASCFHVYPGIGAIARPLNSDHFRLFARGQYFSRQTSIVVLAS